MALAVSAQGTLRFETAEALTNTERLPRALAATVARAFRPGLATGLLHLASKELRTELNSSLAFGRELGKLYLTALRVRGDATGEEPTPPPTDSLCRLLDSLPPLVGAEYATPETLADAWRAMDEVVSAELAAYDGTIHEYLQARNPAWHAVGRVTFHLAEQKNSAQRPFAFLATYAEGVAASGRVRHLPLGKALNVYRADPEQLLRLLRPVHAASERCPFVKSLADSGELYQPLAWTPAEAHAFLLAIPDCEEAGVAVRVPDWWRGRRPPRVQARAQVGAREAAGLGMETVLSFDASLCLDGRELTTEERRAVLEGARGLRLIRGDWIEVDPERLREALEHFESVAATTSEAGLTFAEGMRLLSGADPSGAADETHGSSAREGSAAAWAGVEAGPWLAQLLAELRQPDGAACDPGAALRGTLRPYQRDGVAWLRLLARLGLGGCLADDMGLGKTVQIIALMLLLERDGERDPRLLIVPASLLGNWQAELARFAPSLRLAVAHRSELSRDELAKLGSKTALRNVDVVLTTYGTLARLTWLREKSWGLVVIDEAQAIKNPATAQSRAVKSLKSRMRFALTGTPVENRPGEIWSLFDFLCPSLLGSAREFTAFARWLTADGGPGYGPLRRLLQPYILRRMKTDRAVAPDLPGKTELTVHCGLGKLQVALYEEAVRDLADAIGDRKGIARRGIVLAALLRLKQICNHPSQWTGDDQYDPGESGKFARLAELCETIVARQEKLLVFTQFRELTRPLADYLAGLFGRPGLVLHGGTPVKRRARIVREFQSDDGPPFFVLSLKAGGTGLNLTAANHVIHFDRWWNPAVEDQATDRAFRIGQRRNVLVHAFSCRGTIEDKIDAMLESKRQLAQELLSGGPEKALTELDADELLKLVSLDVRRASN
jgi:non-specific serine/threonine protein kinase